jgi:acyl carrier protein
MLDVAERAKAIVVEQLVADPNHVIDNANFIDDLGADSLDLVELVIKFEQAFGFEISDDDAESILTFGDAVKFLERHALV